TAPGAGPSSTPATARRRRNARRARDPTISSRRPTRAAGRPQADGGRIRSRRVSPGPPSTRPAKILRCGDLHVLDEPPYHTHLMTEPLAEHRVVGADDPIAPSLFVGLA